MKPGTVQREKTKITNVNHMVALWRARSPKLLEAILPNQLASNCWSETVCYPQYPHHLLLFTVLSWTAGWFKMGIISRDIELLQNMYSITVCNFTGVIQQDNNFYRNLWILPCWESCSLLLCAVISEPPPLLIYTAMSLDYTTECAAFASQSFHCASAHKTRAAVAVVANYSVD